MRIKRLPHAAQRVAACVLVLFGALILQGCGDDSAPAQEPTKPAENPYAELDARFPDGRPELRGPEARAQDPAYVGALQAAAQARTAIELELKKAQAEAKAFRDHFAASTSKRLGRELTEADLDAALANHAHYQALAAKVTAAEETLAAKTAEVKRLIAEARGDRALQDYTTLRVKADQSAHEAGLPIRGAQPASPLPAVNPLTGAPAAANPAPATPADLLKAVEAAQAP